MEEKKQVLSVRHLSVTFTRYERGMRQVSLPVIRDLSLDVKAGEMVAVVGSSGSGKSLLAHGILGLLPYNAGCGGGIYFDGELLTEKRKKELRGSHMVLVPQSVSYLDPLMKAGAQVRKGSRKAEDRLKCQTAFGRYGLGPDTEELYPFELSGGMTRRVLIASAVMEHPKLVIADEPTPGLHIDAARRVLSHFREIADGGAGVLLITHDLELALTCADRIVVFYAGMDVEHAGPEDFKEERLLRHPYSKALYRAMPEHGFESVAGAQPYGSEFTEGCPYMPRCAGAGDGCGSQVAVREIRGGKVRCGRAK